MREHDQGVRHDLSQSALFEVAGYARIAARPRHRTQVIEYLKTPPSADELRRILGMLRLSPRQLLRSTEAKAAGLDVSSLEDERLIEAMVANPAMIERPIVVAGAQARIGRPPESVLEIL